MKIHQKIIYLLISIFVLYTVLFTGFIYYSISQYSYADFFKRLEIRAAILAKIRLEEHAEVKGIRDIHQNYIEQLPNQKNFVLPNTPEALLKAKLPVELLKQISKSGKGDFNKKNIFYSGILYTNNDGEKYVVVVSAENYFYSHHVAYLRNLLLSSMIYALLLIVLISFLISRSLTQPIKNIIRGVEAIGSENLHLRLRVPKKSDSLAKLADTFNNMLNRLETSFETQKNFISNASHELNTPLTEIIGEADLALSKPRSEDEYRAALAKILEAAEKLDKKTKALLYLARTGFDGKVQRFYKIRVDQLILDVKETVERINSNFKIRLDFSLLPENPEQLKITGNEELLHLALSNIVVNACKYSDNQPVYVGLGVLDKQVLIFVRDTGIGIPEDEIKHIYDPYFRGSNTTNYEGFGIGLPLSRNIVRMHNGQLTVHSVVSKGTTVEIKLPLGNYRI